MDNFSESAWVRGWSDTKKGLGTWQFWGLEVFGGGLMAIFFNPFAAFIFILGVTLALWIGATSSAPGKQRNELRQEIRGQTEEEGQFPDMAIRDLFFYVNSEVLDNKNWLDIGKEVRDMASIGRLTIWGRIHRPGFSAALEKINPSYWTEADFNYRFLADDTDSIPHTNAGVGQTELADLQVNKQQVESIWKSNGAR